MKLGSLSLAVVIALLPLVRAGGGDGETQWMTTTCWETQYNEKTAWQTDWQT